MASIEQKLKPFVTPNHVVIEVPPGRRQDGFQRAPSLPLNAVPEDVLLQMCEDFKNEVLAKHRSKETLTVETDASGELFVPCAKGGHNLESQLADDGNTLIGLSKVENEND